MARYDFKIVGQYNVLRSIEYNSEDTVNLYIVNDPTSKKPDSLQPMAGMQKLFELPNDSAIRENGLFKLGNAMYGVSGENFYQYNASGAAVFIGFLTTANGRINWANSPTEIAIVDGANLYSYDTVSGAFQIITTIQAVGFPTSPQSIYYQDARFILSFRNSPNYYYSGFADTTTGALEKWDANNVFIQQSRPDLSVGISGSNERLFLFGSQSVEIWAPYTTPNLLPFYRDNNFIYEFGCGATGSIIKGVLDVKQGQPVTSFVHWLTTNSAGAGSFVISTGGMPAKISSEAVDLLISTFTRVDDCISTVYKEGAHVFIEETFPSQDKSLVIDLNTGSWFRKERTLTDTNDTLRSLINSHVYFGNKHYVGGTVDASIYELSNNYLTEDGTPIKRTRSSFTFTDTTYRRLICNLVEIDFEAGNVESDQNPIAYLSISFDGGRTYGNPRPAPMGRIGQYRWKAQWLGIGQSYNFTFKVETWDAVRVYILGGMIDYEVLSE